MCEREGMPYRPHRLWICQNQVSGAPAFNHRGIDFVGPVYVKGTSGIKKAYICLFTCATSRALHLGLPPDLSMEPFIRCLKWFTGQCGRPIFIMTDNAKTFKRANKELGRLLKIKRTQDFTANQGIKVYPTKGAMVGWLLWAHGTSGEKKPSKGSRKGTAFLWRTGNSPDRTF